MRTFARALLVTLALLSSGVLQVAAAWGGDACCAEEDAQSPECPPAGACCECCPVRVARTSSSPDVAPSSLPGVAMTIASAEPLSGPSPEGIFQPPRA